MQHRRDHMTLGRLYVHPGLDWRQRSGSSRTHHNQDMATLVIARCAGHAGVEHLHRHPVWLFALPAVQLNQEGQKTLPPENSNPFRRWKYATGIGLRHQPVDHAELDTAWYIRRRSRAAGIIDAGYHLLFQSDEITSASH